MRGRNQGAALACVAGRGIVEEPGSASSDVDEWEEAIEEPGSASSSTATLFGAELVTQEPGSASSSTTAVHLTCRSESTL